MGVALTSLSIMVGYIIATWIIGILGYKYSKTVEGYFLAKRELSALPVACFMYAEYTAGAGTVGLMARAYRVGISAGWYTLAIAIGFILVGLIAASYYRRTGAYTVPEVMFVRWNDVRIRSLAAIILVVVYVMIFIAQPPAFAAILGPMLGISLEVAAALSAILFMILALLGGLKGLSWMNVIHAFVLFFSIFAVVLAAISAVGGFDEIVQRLPPTYFRLDQPDILTIVGTILATTFAVPAAAPIGAVLLGAKDERTAKLGAFGAAFGLQIPAAIVFPLVGVIGAALYPGINPKEVIWAVSRGLGETWAGVASIGIVAALLSTAPALLLAAATMVSEDLYRTIRPHASEKERLTVARVTIVVAGLLGAIFGPAVKSILGVILDAFAVRAYLGLLILLGIVWKSIDRDSAFWSGVASFVASIVWLLMGKPYGLSVAFPSLGVGLLVLLVLMAAQKLRRG